MADVNWLCWLMGHKDGDEQAYCSGWFVCERCGEREDQPTFHNSWHVLAYYRLKWAAINRYWRAVHWLRRCDVCGRRFNRCPDDDAHLPF